MFGRKELERVHLQKQALILESSLNRYALRAELQVLRSAAGWMSTATRAPRRVAGVLTLLAALAGFFAVKSARRPDSWLNRLAALAKWVGPLYTLWRSFSAPRKKT